MMRQLTRRLFQAILVLAGVAILNFFLFRLSPGDASNLYFNPKIKLQKLQSLREQRGLNDAWYVQCFTWFKKMAAGDWGYSWSKFRSVKEILAEAVPATLQLTVLALSLLFILGCLGGVVGGVLSGGRLGHIVDYGSLLLYAIPSFCLALAGIYFFGIKLQLLPTAQMRSFFADSLSPGDQLLDRVRHLILPVATLTVSGAAATSRFVQSHMKNVLQQDYIRLARAKGLTPLRVFGVHALRNALLPVITLVGLYLPFLLSSAFIVEVIFSWPGIGRMTYEAILAKDYPLLMAANFLVATLVVAGNLLADLLYAFFDPRIQWSDSRSRR